MKLRYVVIGIAMATILSACGAEEPAPQPQANQPADNGTDNSDSGTDQDLPDLIIPENE